MIMMIRYKEGGKGGRTAAKSGAKCVDSTCLAEESNVLWKLAQAYP